MRHVTMKCLVFVFAAAVSIAVQAGPTFFSNRADFLAAIGESVTDDYSGYGTTVGSSVKLTNSEMNSVFGETEYETTSFTDWNLVGDVFIRGDSYSYCAGCNGGFRLGFGNTSLTVGNSVFAVGLDILLHTSRHSSIGDTLAGDTVLPGTVLVTFGDGSSEDVIVPADIGFFDDAYFFLGLTDSRGIRSLTIGTEPLSQRHFWVIDNLTIGSQDVPEPATLALLMVGLLGAVVARRKAK